MKVSIIIVVKNEETYIRKCLDAIFSQSFQEFEVVIVNNGSTDETENIIDSFAEKRIKYIYEPADCGIGELRNIGIRSSRGEYIFFTDADCVPGRYWLEEGLRILEAKNYVGVEGKTYYESTKKPTISDSNIYQFSSGEFMTCNIAYSRQILEKVNYFDPAFRYGHEDRDLAFRAMKFGKIYYSPDMLVSHQRKELTPQALFNLAKRAEDQVLLIKKHGIKKKVLYPSKLLFIFCPPLLLLTERYTSLKDLIIGIFKYLSYIYERLIIYKAAVKNGIFVI